LTRPFHHVVGHPATIYALAYPCNRIITRE
jgi:hypothetical protein